MLQKGKEQLQHDYNSKMEAAVEAERAIARAMATQIESLQRQVANLSSLEAEDAALKASVEVQRHQ